MYYCGEKMPFISCSGTTTKPINIKFSPNSAIKTLEEKNIGEFQYDDGSLAERRGVFTYGWTKVATMVSAENLELENNKLKLIAGTGAEMVNADSEWFIELPNGKYDLKVMLKIVENKSNSKEYATLKVPMNFKINDTEVVSEPMNITGEIVHDIPNVNVNSQELRVHWLAGLVPLISISITPQAMPAEMSAIRKEVFKNT